MPSKAQIIKVNFPEQSHLAYNVQTHFRLGCTCLQVWGLKSTLILKFLCKWVLMLLKPQNIKKNNFS